MSRHRLHPFVPVVSAAGVGAALGWACGSALALDGSPSTLASVPQVVGAVAGSVVVVLAVRHLERNRP